VIKYGTLHSRYNLFKHCLTAICTRKQIAIGESLRPLSKNPESEDSALAAHVIIPNTLNGSKRKELDDVSIGLHECFLYPDTICQNLYISGRTAVHLVKILKYRRVKSV